MPHFNIGSCPKKSYSAYQFYSTTADNGFFPFKGTQADS